MAMAGNRSFWITVLVVAILVTALGFWSVRAYRRSQSRSLLNSFAPFQNPPLGLVFPRVLAATDSSRQVLAAGVREGVWGVSERAGRSPSLEVWLTVQGQKWFSIVGSELVATFKAGRRQVTEVESIEQTFPSRLVRFRYIWQEFHPGTAVLGSGMPEPNREYAGEALLLYEGEEWRVMHWTTPDYDEAIARFKNLQSP
jgi:hypothetical protein